jgi:putative transposase
MSVPDRRVRLDRAHRSVSIRRQCQLLGLARSGVYRMRIPLEAAHHSGMKPPAIPR